MKTGTWMAGILAAIASTALGLWLPDWPGTRSEERRVGKEC